MSDSSKTDICNLALSHLASAKEIQDLDMDKTAEAGACRRYYDRVRKIVFRSYPWPQFMTYAALDLVATSSTGEYSNAYRVPADCLNTIKICSGRRADTERSAIPFTKSSDAQGELILTDAVAAILQYTRDEPNPAFYESDFEMMISYLLAFYIAPRVTAGDPNGLGKRAYDAYNVMASQVKARAQNELQKDREPWPEMVRARFHGDYNEGYCDPNDTGGFP